MGYFKTKHERRSARLTTLITLIILLLMFVIGNTYMDPPEEYGVAVNFGTNDYGSGNKPLSKPRQADVQKNVEQENVEEQKVEPVSSETKSEDVLTQETEEALAIKKKKIAEAKAKAEAERKERLKQEAEQKILDTRKENINTAA